MSNIQKFSNLMNVNEKMLAFPLKQVFDENIECNHPFYDIWRNAYLNNKPLPVKGAAQTLMIAKALSEGFQLFLVDPFKNNALPKWLLDLTNNPDLFEKDQLKNKFVVNDDTVLNFRTNTENINTLLSWDSNFPAKISTDIIPLRLLQLKDSLIRFFKNNEPHYRNSSDVFAMKECLDILEKWKQPQDFIFMDKIIKKNKIQGLTFKKFFEIKDDLLYENFNNKEMSLNNITFLLVANQIDKPLSKEKIDSLLNCEIHLLYEILTKKQFYAIKYNLKDKFLKELKQLEIELINHPSLTSEQCFALFEIDGIDYDSIIPLNKIKVSSYSLFPHHFKKWLEILNNLLMIGVNVNKENAKYLFEKNYFDVYVKNKIIVIDNDSDLNLNL